MSKRAPYLEQRYEEVFAGFLKEKDKTEEKLAQQLKTRAGEVDILQVMRLVGEIKKSETLAGSEDFPERSEERADFMDWFQTKLTDVIEKNKGEWLNR